MLLLFASIVASAQENVTVTFTANTETGLYCPFSSINAINVTRGWTETLTYPDTVLVLSNTVGVNEHLDKPFYLGDAYPNPFKGETYASLELPERSNVMLQVVRVDGSEVAIQSLSLDAGTYRLKVSLSTPNLAFLSVTTNYGRQVLKLVHTGHGTKDALDVDFVSTMTKSLDAAGSLKLDVTNEFEPGDVMRYEAQLIDGGATIFSAPVTQPQYGDETITLRFALTLPTVTTNSVTDITQTSAICGGNVTDAGGLMVMARGVCWGTQHNPMVNGSHTSDGMGVGGFTSNMAGLTAETTYYVRAYAVNRLGTSYGDEMSFTTSSSNAHEYVDLGLPSGLLWATCNVGAETPEEYGDYFAWGETTPKDYYDWDTYRYSNGCFNGDNPILTKYCNDSVYGYNGYTDTLTILQPSDDAATANWGSWWRMPTQSEFQELFDNTTLTWTQQNGVDGFLLTASNGNSLFLPAAGLRFGGSLNEVGYFGYYWSSSLRTDFPGDAWHLCFYYWGTCYMDFNWRCSGFSVRPVCSARQN